MMRIEAEIERIRRSGQALRDAAGGAADIDLPTAAYSVSIALPATRIASAALRVAEAWHEQLAAWCRDAQAHGDGVIAAAVRYRKDDEAAAADIRGIAAPRGT